MEPGRIHFLMRARSVSSSLDATGSMKILLLLCFSLPPNTHWPACIRPRWYLRFPNFASSISTSMPGPPVGVLTLMRCSSHTSLAKLHQSTQDLDEMLSSCSMTSWETFLVHQYVNFNSSAMDKLLFSNQECFRIDCEDWCGFLPRSRHLHL